MTPFPTFVSNNAGNVVRWGQPPPLLQWSSNVSGPTLIPPTARTYIDTALPESQLLAWLADARRYLASGMSATDAINQAFRQDSIGGAERNTLIGILEDEQSAPDAQLNALACAEQQAEAAAVAASRRIDTWEYKPLGSQ